MGIPPQSMVLHRPRRLSRGTRAVIAMVGLVLICVVRGATNLGHPVRFYNVDAIVSLSAAFEFYDNDQHCRGFGDYGDVDQGAELRLADDKGRVLAVWRLGSGRPYTNGGPCEFELRPVRLFTSSQWFTFTVAGRHPMQRRAADLRPILVLDPVRS